ncbi:acyltransferase family protein [Agromyces sp. NPDC058136]|uniref:acyltransferase family protein n=1 Tax=Agromyces sp. NPDC058136 TaxID=3346354 RepID=UPI0036DDDD4B
MAEKVLRVRLDIQLLRALAVGGVLAYHLWPNRVPGGFVGVDVFFVISGFLITAHLLRSAEGADGVHLGKFWANRARRLLPLASVVLLASVVAIFAFLPQSVWKVSLQGIIASALYVENWNLAAGSVDYLARDQAPTIVQHFWSLSVEEQFYIVWPLLLLLAVWIAGRAAHGVERSEAVRRRRIRLAAFLAILAVFVASFAYSIWITPNSPGLAYFATPTRAWEFAAGAMLAFLPQPAPVARGARTPSVRLAASWAGFALMIGTMLVLTTQVPFPGAVAAIPVLGACLFIWGGDIRRPFAPTALAGFRPVTYLGDISYGVYLWHWPLIIVASAMLGGALSTPAKIGILVATFGLAALSKIFIEDPFRYRRFWRQRWWRGFYPASVGVLAVCTVAVVGLASIQFAGSTAVAGGGVANELGEATDPLAPLTPSLANRAGDHDEIFECFDMNKTGPYICSYGVDDADVSIAVTGDSHAAHFIPALIDIVEDRGWKLTTYVGMNCDDTTWQECKGGAEMSDRIITGGYDLVVYSAYRYAGSDIDDVAASVTRLHDSGVPLMLIEDVPFHPTSTFDCLDAAGGDPAASVKCTTPVAEALDKYPDRVVPIAKSLGLEAVPMQDLFCTETECMSIDGNVIIYQDAPGSHLTSTFSRLLAPRLGAEIDARISE